jgi:uncharacterized protein involved in exopolysaccharide biosynthesis
MSTSAIAANPTEPVSIVQVLRTLFGYWRLIALCTAVGVGLAVTAALVMHPVYRAETLLSYNDEQSSGLDVSGIASQFSGLASLAGVNLNTSKSQKDTALALLTAQGFLESFINDHHLMPVLFSSRWDAEQSRWRPARWGKGPPTLSDGVKRIRKSILTVTEDRRTGLIRVAVEWRDRQVAAEWANDLVRRVNDNMRAWAIRDAREGQKYLRAELDRTDVVELRQSVNRLLETELKKEMVASVRVQYTFRVIDAAMPPDDDDFVRPRRLVLAVFGLFAGLVLGVTAALGLNALRRYRSAA